MKQITFILMGVGLTILLAACAPTVESSMPEVTAVKTATIDPRITIIKATPAANGECSHACQLTIVNAYFAALDQVYSATSSQEDIDHLFTLFHENVKYEHIDFDANFEKAAWKAAFSNNLQRSVYKNEKHEKIGILNVIHGKNHLAVEYAYGAEDENGNWDQNGAGLFALFGFAGDKIILVREYW